MSLGLQKILFLFFSIMLSTLTCLGQDIKVLGNNSFEHAGNSYDRYTLRSVMEKNEDALVQYDHYINTFQNTRRERLVGSLLMVGGGIVIREGFKRFFMEKNGDEALFYTGLAGFLIGSGLVVASFRRKQHVLADAIQIYNNGPQDIGGQQSYIKLGLTDNGLGAVYGF